VTGIITDCVDSAAGELSVTGRADLARVSLCSAPALDIPHTKKKILDIENQTSFLFIQIALSTIDTIKKLKHPLKTTKLNLQY